MFGFMRTGYCMPPKAFLAFCPDAHATPGLFYPFTLMPHAASGLSGNCALKRHIFSTGQIGWGMMA